MVTGGARGIGAAITATLARAGYHVAAGYGANQAAAEEFAGRILRLGTSYDMVLVTVRRNGDSHEQTYPLDRWGIYPTNDCLRFQHEFRVKPYGKLQITKCKH